MLLQTRYANQLERPKLHYARHTFQRLCCFLGQVPWQFLADLPLTSDDVRPSLAVPPCVGTRSAVAKKVNAANYAVEDISTGQWRPCIWKMVGCRAISGVPNDRRDWLAPLLSRPFAWPSQDFVTDATLAGRDQNQSDEGVGTGPTTTPNGVGKLRSTRTTTLVPHLPRKLRSTNLHAGL